MSEDYLAQEPKMEWNTQKKIWQLCQGNTLFEHWEPFLETWPSSGTMRNGLVFELQTQEPLISVSESSSSPTLPTTRSQNGENRNNKIWERDPSKPQNLENALYHVLPIPDDALLRSPTASQGEGGALGEETAKARGNTVGIRDNAIDIARLNGHAVSRVEMNLMPTPNTMDMLPARDPSKIDKSKGGHANVRETVVNELLGTPRTSSANGFSSVQVETGAPKARIEDQVQLLPTVTTQDGKNNAGPSQFDRNTKPLNVEAVIATDTNWGRFEPAIRRWELVLGRSAPLPTKPDGKEGAHRLSSAFTEWMMGLEEGWITNAGLTRNEELRACGNGVVPQQAELALRMLLEGVEIEH